MVRLEDAVVAKLHIEGKVFEILVDSDQALLLKQGKQVSMADILADDKVYTDSRKGLVAPHTALKAIFGSDDIDVVAKEIIMKGVVHLTAAHRAKEVEEKRKRILEYLHKHAVDPKTHLPHPLNRLELAFDEAKIHLDEHKEEMQQIDAIIKKLRPILPLKFEIKQISIVIPAAYAGKAYSHLRSHTKMVKDSWDNNGAWVGVVEVPAAQQAELYDLVGKLTHGEAQLETLKIEAR